MYKHIHVCTYKYMYRHASRNIRKCNIYLNVNICVDTHHSKWNDARLYIYSYVHIYCIYVYLYMHICVLCVCITTCIYTFVRLLLSTCKKKQKAKLLLNNCRWTYTCKLRGTEICCPTISKKN